MLTDSSIFLRHVSVYSVRRKLVNLCSIGYNHVGRCHRRCTAVTAYTGGLLYSSCEYNHFNLTLPEGKARQNTCHAKSEGKHCRSKVDKYSIVHGFPPAWYLLMCPENTSIGVSCAVRSERDKTNTRVIFPCILNPKAEPPSLNGLREPLPGEPRSLEKVFEFFVKPQP